MLKYNVSPRRDATFQKLCCLTVGKHHFWKQTFRLGHIYVFKFVRCFAMAKQHFQHAHVSQKGSMGNKQLSRQPNKTRKPRFQDQWVAKAIEKAKNNIRMNGCEPEPLILNFCLLCFLDGFGCPLVLKSWFSCLFYLWFWLPMDLGILVFLFVFGCLDSFGSPSGLHTCIALVFSMVLQIAFAIKVVSSCIPYTCSFPSCLRAWRPLVFIGFTNGFCFHIGFQLRSCMPPMSSSMYWRAFLANDVLASTRACVSK